MRNYTKFYCNLANEMKDIFHCEFSNFDTCFDTSNFLQEKKHNI